MYYNKADLGMNVALAHDINQLFDYAFFGFEEYFFVGPRPEPLPQIENVSYPFDRETWLFTLLSLLLVSLLSVIIHRIHEVAHSPIYNDIPMMFPQCSC